MDYVLCARAGFLFMQQGLQLQLHLGNLSHRLLGLHPERQNHCQALQCNGRQRHGTGVPRQHVSMQ